VIPEFWQSLESQVLIRHTVCFQRFSWCSQILIRHTVFLQRISWGSQILIRHTVCLQRISWGSQILIRHTVFLQRISWCLVFLLGTQCSSRESVDALRLIQPGSQGTWCKILMWHLILWIRRFFGQLWCTMCFFYSRNYQILLTTHQLPLKTHVFQNMSGFTLQCREGMSNGVC
jgi:hypothetical protein